MRRRPMRLGVLTGGGDCPGLNAVIRAVVRRGTGLGHDLVGLRDGWRGILERDTLVLDLEAVRGILPRGGTILGSSRTNPFRADDGAERVQASSAALGLDGLIAIGGEDTLGAAHRLSAAGVPVIGVPKTIDNDLGGTDMTFGFDTAVQVCSDAIDRLHTTAESHKRVMILEVMGRHAGWIALWSGLAGGADIILVPERPFALDVLVERLEHRVATHRFALVVVAEGATPAGSGLAAVGQGRDEFGHERLGGIGQALEVAIHERTGYDARATVLGHIQRGGTPTAFDRVLATRLGVAAIEAADRGEWGTMAALRATEIVQVGLAEAVAELRLLTDAELHVHEALVT